MSIVNVKNGRYIKVIRELTVFRPNSVEVYFYSFLSKNEKEEYFKRREQISEFLFRCENFISTKYCELNSQVEEWIKRKELTSVDYSKLPKHIRDSFDDLENLGKWASEVKFNWDTSTPITRFNNWDIVSELGFEEAWLTPLAHWEISSVHTGIFTNQTFSYDCLYKELKKIFKDDYVDC